MKNILTKKEQETLDIMGFKSLNEVLEYYPFRYEYVDKSLYKDWILNKDIYFEGKIISSFKVIRYGYKKNKVSFDVLVEDNYVIHCTIFNRVWITKMDTSKSLTFHGKYDGFDKVTLSSYNAIPLNEQIGIQPVYSLKENVNLKYLKNVVRKALDNCKVNSYIPGSLCQRYRLYPKDEAIKQIHFPENKQLLDLASRTLKYEEFLKFETLILLRRRNNVLENINYQKKFDVNEVFKLANNLEFTLTTDQVKTINEILYDLQQPKSMYRLVQGDVGCGKTIVATLALYANYLANYQGAFMVPTEILAKQQYDELKKVFKNTKIKLACLYSSLTTSEKRKILEELNNGNIDIVVGTHALIQDSVNFNNLGLVVTDEQHRFGVKQRARLNEKGQYTDILVMSATPIPRTMASIMYGDTDISTIKTLPANRKPVITKIIEKNSIIPFYGDLCQMLEEGSKAYIVCPMIEENDKLRNVSDITNALNNEFKGKYQIASLNGKMTPLEKNEVMDGFKNGNTQILVSTTVIEVGVNVKEANIMIIYDADRFGLSQLHQLRGRVKRGSKQGYCYLLTNNYRDDTKERLDALANNENGFDIADLDLKFRGFGDLFGERQSGLPSFKIGNIETDMNIIKCAMLDAKEIIDNPQNEDDNLLNYAIEYLNNLDEID